MKEFLCFHLKMVANKQSINSARFVVNGSEQAKKR
jgi:hypothetical protein